MRIPTNVHLSEGVGLRAHHSNHIEYGGRDNEHICSPEEITVRRFDLCNQVVGYWNAVSSL